MLNFVELDKASTIYSNSTVNKIMVPLALDTMANCQLYRTLSQKHPDLDSKFAEIVGRKPNKVGDFIKVKVDSGHIIYFIIIRAIEKFQPYILDVTKSIERALANAKKDAPDGDLLFPMPVGDDIKLSDTIFIPAILNTLLHSEVNVIVLSNGDHEQYVEAIEDGYIRYKINSWKSDWMLTLDDIILLKIIQQVVVLCHDFKINKNNLVKCYRVCCDNGMFPKIEWYTTPIGPFFKMFLPKSNSLINHGLLLNSFHYSNAEPKRFSASLGPYFPHLCYIAYDIFGKNSDKIIKIANDIKIEHIKSYQAKQESPEPYQQKTLF